MGRGERMRRIIGPGASHCKRLFRAVSAQADPPRGDPSDSGVGSGRVNRADVWMIVAITLFWGLNYPIMKFVVTDYPPLTFRSLSFAIGLVALGAWLLRERGSLAALRVPRAERRDVFRLSVGSMIGWHLGLIYGVMLLNSGRAAIIGYTMPVWALVASVVFYGERFSWRGVLGVALALGATALLAMVELEAFLAAPLGVGVMLAGAVSWGVGTAMARNTRLGIDSESLTFWTLGIAMTVFVVGAVTFERSAWRLPDLPEALAMLYGGVVTFAFCYVGWFRVARKLPPVASSLSIMLVPVVGLFSGALMLGETITGFDLLALGLILAAMAAVLWPALRSALTPRRPPPC